MSIRNSLAFVLGFAVSFAAIAATVSAPPEIGDLPVGFAFLFCFASISFAFARVFSGDRLRRAYWLAFLAVFAAAGLITLIEPVSALNSVPEHLARYILRRAETADENVYQSNERFYAMQHVLTLSGVWITAFISATFAGRFRAKENKGSQNKVP